MRGRVDTQKELVRCVDLIEEGERKALAAKLERLKAKGRWPVGDGDFKGDRYQMSVRYCL